jgi:DNA-directed RNA polymerase subunit RPC12/RpoP
MALALFFVLCYNISMICLNCGKEIELKNKKAKSYCSECASIRLTEYHRNYRKTRNINSKEERIEKFDNLFKRINETDPIKLSYIAGLFDGEGSVSIIKTKPAKEGQSFQYALHVTISNQDTDVLYFVKDTLTLGGVHNCRGYNYKWISSNRGAAIFLKCLAPYLHIKKDRALIGVEFQSLVTKDFHGLKCGLSKEQLDKREQLRQQVLGLNHPNISKLCT